MKNDEVVTLRSALICAIVAAEEAGADMSVLLEKARAGVMSESGKYANYVSTPYKTDVVAAIDEAITKA
ncbi:hypothetical protein M6D76_08535 [Alcaligenes faecalis]|uniref:hypothetical protein n=1 Tax=Alcaligenes faecalis TaxID=511 RepID=UPI00211BA5FC|nr:hypothetical protein [Alcaligenes faecalis]UUO12708.1 hypothetical protein M6D76_08535 [Alcaligenes faecalis]